MAFDDGSSETVTIVWPAESFSDCVGPWQCVKQTLSVRCPPLHWGGGEGGSAQRPPEAMRRSRIFFLSYLVAISFPIEFDVWGRLWTHFEAAKVMTLPPVTQHFSVSTTLCNTKPELFFFRKGQRNRSRKDREREDTDFAQYSRKQE